MITDLIPKNINPVALFSQNGLDPVLNEIKKKVDEFVPNLETASGRKEIASFAYKIAQSKTFLDDLGKKLVADRKEEIKLVDNERKRARDFLDAEKDRARKPLTEWEATEAEKEELRRKEAAYLIDWDDALAMDDLFNREREIRRKEAEFARIEAESRAIAEANRIEKERIAREEQIRKEAEERARREAAEKIEAEKQRALKAEADAKAAAEKAERDRIAAEERAKMEAERAEQARIAALKKAEEDKQYAIKKAQEDAAMEARTRKEAEEREAARIKAEADKKAANKAHQAKINNEILADLMSFGQIPPEIAKEIIKGVVGGKIRHMRIQY